MYCVFLVCFVMFVSGGENLLLVLLLLCVFWCWVWWLGLGWCLCLGLLGYILDVCCYLDIVVVVWV